MPLCARCGVNPRPEYHSYCSDCKKAYRKEHPEDRSKKYKRVSPFPELCGKCKQRPHAKGNAWCRECQNAAARVWRSRNGGSWKALTPENRQHAVARRYVKTRVDRGQMLKLPCFICGDPNVSAHHYLGYDKAHALDILWLCRLHHLECERGLWWPIVPSGYSLATALAPKTLEERLYSKVDKTLDCWLYTGRLNDDGYGMFDLPDGRTEGAHRTAWKLANGEIPEGCIIGHLCNVRHCVNPKHLIAWPKGDDVRYMEQCGRGVHPCGEANGNAARTEDEVREIRRLYASKLMGAYNLAKKYQTSPQAIYDIVNRVTWPHLP